MRHPLRQAVSPRRRPLGDENGQAIVLGALSMFVLALMLMMSFNLTQAVHSKIRLQQHTDAMAYSMAVVEARGMNYLAYSNRAMAAAYVAMTTLHAYMAAATVTAAMLQQGRNNFYMVAAIEFILCATCCWPWCFSMCKHCIHGIKAIRIARKFAKEAKDYAKKIKKADKKFQKAVKALELMIQGIYWSQQAMLTHVADVIGRGSKLDRLKEINAPQSDGLPLAIGGINVLQLACVLENSPLDSLCLTGPTKAGKEEAQKVMTDVANATRHKWPARRGWMLPTFIPLHLHPSFLVDLMNDIQGSGVTLPFAHKATAKMVSSDSQSELHKKQGASTGKHCGADEHGMMFSYWKHGFGIGSYKAEVYSPGKHKTSPNIGVHDGEHEFDGVNAKEGLGCLTSGNCFVKYRADDEGQNLAAVFAFHKQDLSVDADGQHGAWEVTDSGSVEIEHGEQGTGRVTLRAGEGKAMSKALVYYHKIGPDARNDRGTGNSPSWSDPPNLFMPYWRAKLHPFDAVEAALVLGAGGEADKIPMLLAAPAN